MKINGIYTVVVKHCMNIKQLIKEYTNIDYFGFPMIRKIVIISKFPRIINK
jgi:hypothetical protein